MKLQETHTSNRRKGVRMPVRTPILYLTALLLFVLTGCNSENTSDPVEEPGITGYVMDIGEEGLLVVSAEAEEAGGTGGVKEYYNAAWAGNAPGDVEVGECVEIRLEGGVNDSYPLQATVGELEVIPGSTPEGATLSDTEALNKALTMETFENEILTVQSMSFDAERDEWSIVLKNTDSYEEYTIRVEDK